MNLTTIKAKPFKQRCYIDYYKREDRGEQDKNDDIAKRCIVNHPFNQKLEVLLPTNDEHTKNIIDCLSGSVGPGSSFYTVAPLRAFVVEKEFLSLIRRNSNLIALSHGRIDQDNVFCIVGGKLYLSMTRETYQRAGLQGDAPSPNDGDGDDSKSTKNKKKRRRGTLTQARSRNHYLVTFNLLSPKLVPGKPGFERLVWSLENTPLRHAVPWTICGSDTADPSRSSSSSLSSSNNNNDDTESLEIVLKKCFAKYPFKSIPCELKVDYIGPVKRASFSHFTKQDYNNNNKKQISKTTKNEIFTEWAMELHEYLAMISMNCDRIQKNDSVDPFISTYEPPLNDENNWSLSSELFVKLSWQGGIIPRWFISDIQNILQSRADMYSLTCFGFKNAPLSWKEQLHSGITMFDNLYTVLQLPPNPNEQQQHQHLVVYQIVGDCDAH